MVTAASYEAKHAKKFCNDMIRAGLEPYHYHGRFYYEGPAVNVDDIQDALSNTKVSCSRDSMGKGYVVYPAASAKLKDNSAPKAGVDLGSGPDKTFVVTVTRKSWGSREIEVKAVDAKEAQTKAIDMAGNFEYSEHDAEYEVDFVQEKK